MRAKRSGLGRIFCLGDAPALSHYSLSSPLITPGGHQKLKQTENILQNTTRGGCKAAGRGEAVLRDDGRLRQDDQGGRLDGTVSRFRHILHLYLHLQVVDISISLSKINGKL